jgi:hypothetical protein
MIMFSANEMTADGYRQAFRDEVAVQISPKLIHLLFDEKFKKEAQFAGLEVDELLVAYIWQFTDKLWEGR